MILATKTFTTKVHTGTVNADDIRAVVLSSAIKQLGLAPEAVVSSKAETAADGSVSLEIVEGADAPDAAPDVSAPETSAAPEVLAAAPSLVMPTA